ncbi:MAG: hypothetical protein CSB44_02485 [Gammaproteobacteria bacterium]|nr:MAG: hypothetical protein CSB44_02485 [Gammaproteobacteria bacterium]
MLGVLVIVLLGGAGAAYWGWNDYQRWLEEPLPIAPGEEFVVERGWTVSRVGSELEARGWLDKPHWFRLFTRLEPTATRIKAGEYVFEGPQTPAELFDVLDTGQTRQYSASIIEGSNWKQMLEDLQGAEHLVKDLGVEIIKPSVDKTNPELSISADELVTKLGLDVAHPEGMFYADTYAFPKDSSETDYLRRANRLLEAVLAEEWSGRDEGLPLETPYEALILASIVEKETAVPAERPLIAGVFISRLKKGMRLQTDPTVIYGMGDAFTGNIRRSDLTTDTPWNTYTRAGLPPTPIAMVGREAIHAVMHPAATTALYFVSRGDGSHHFSDTLEEHNVAVRKYQLRR